ncbi:hypothetical protein [Streptomyces sp. NPDC046939]|uniref:hypothetical protein n=1 Tax=Streptomyces sp. NPDC046939 TaxID=3155376 RepID=UPI00340E9B44
MYYNPINSIVRSACADNPMLIVHKHSGSHFKQGGDLQLVGDAFDPAKPDKAALWVFQVIQVDKAGNALYQIKNHGSGLAMGINKDNPLDGIQFAKPHAADETTKEARAQMWTVEIFDQWSQLLVPALHPDLYLAPMGKNPGANGGCYRPSDNPGGQPCDLNPVQIVPPKPPKDPACNADCTTC